MQDFSRFSVVKIGDDVGKRGDRGIEVCGVAGGEGGTTVITA